jgi:3-hydroxy-9,10-secoandrosta-1,3,5(10)-triene-9,17-dione monooxygenase reductase component
VTAPSPDEFRRAMALLPTAVTVLTAPGDEGPAGATANAVASLSLEPPLMIAALDRDSRTLAAVHDAGGFGINVLAADQEALARAFATKAPHPEKWSDVTWSDHAGVPIIGGCVLWVSCRLRDAHDGGDHVILTGRVEAVGGNTGNPLLFHEGAYRPLSG